MSRTGHALAQRGLDCLGLLKTASSNCDECLQLVAVRGMSRTCAQGRELKFIKNSDLIISVVEYIYIVKSIFRKNCRLY